MEQFKPKIALVGLGYVGLPIAVAFGIKQPVVGFDISVEKVNELKSGIDRTGEVNLKDLQSTNVEYTADPSQLTQCDFIIVAVPTPITEALAPDFTALKGASKLIGENLSKDTIVVYESTVYPGATEEICIPILEQTSGLKCGEDFKVGYSPERINPGDKVHTLQSIIKVVSAQDSETLDKIACVYEQVVDAGVHRAQSIKVAEAAKVIENTQRDLNIALMNELALIFDRLDIDTQAVLEAAGTKWNFLKFSPGLVGGHCIGVDPYYLTYKAESVGYHPEVILAGRRINIGMGKFVAEQTVKRLSQLKTCGASIDVAVLGLTFKEDVPDLRNSRVPDIIEELKEYGVNVHICDPMVESIEAEREYDYTLLSMEDLPKVDAIVVAVAHTKFINQKVSDFIALYKNTGEGVFIDVKGVFDQSVFPETVSYWRL
ncbi:MAG TPA: nucleotide sugar dehydrogenase [Crenotrichaceae bacterium]|nr:nucleotide sugar dehydrogenase [Crenotrichaceae bacterium]